MADVATAAATAAAREKGLKLCMREPKGRGEEEEDIASRKGRRRRTMLLKG